MTDSSDHTNDVNSSSPGGTSGAAQSGWYVMHNGQQCGPYSLNDLISALYSNSFAVTDYCWKKGMQNWMPINAIPEIMNQYTPPPPRPEAQGYQQHPQTSPPSPHASYSQEYTRPAPPPRRHRSQPVRLTMPKIPIVPIIGLLLLAGIGVGAYFYFGFNYPSKIREARTLYDKGQYTEAYWTISEYIEDLTKKQMEEAAKALKTAMDGNKVKMKSDIRPHPEMYFLMGKLLLHHRDAIPSAAQKSHLFNFGLTYSYDANFIHAIRIDASYREKIVGELGKAIEKKVHLNMEEMVHRGVTEQCLPKIQTHDFNVAMDMLRTITRNVIASYREVNSLIKSLSDYDPKLANEFESKLPQPPPSETSLKPAIGKALLSIEPQIVESFNTLTDEEIAALADTHGRELRGIISLFDFMMSVAPKDERCKDLLAAMLTTSQKIPPSGLAPDTWDTVVDYAVTYPDTYLDTILNHTEKCGALALTLLNYCPGMCAGFKNASQPSRKESDECFSEEIATRVHESISKLFVDTALAHAYKNPHALYDHYCNLLWPNIDMLEVANQEVGKRPSLLEDEDFVFALGWTARHSYTSNRDRGRFIYNLLFYLTKYPEGKHSAISRQYMTLKP